jgi:NADH-quinone oxidoreductase subunit H
MSEYVKMIAMSALFATFFLGGWSGPGAQNSWLLSLIYFTIKVLVCLLAIVWTRATLPRFRYDKLMAFGWKVLLPIGLANVMVTALLIALNVPGYR